jgi:predicted nucleic acid-binding protein
MVDIEIAGTFSGERRRRIMALLPPKRESIELSSALFRRAGALMRRGVRPADAVHVAAAEAAKADVLLTCDDQMCRRGLRLGSELRLRIVNPLDWLQEFVDASNA